MNPEIRELPSEVIDQIAAGEVVERPAHMVKELVENSIDAGATQVSISIENGGRAVRIEDDGVGIREDQLRLALSRHATSKIEKAADLWALNSFGFRGEALASVASVSQLTLRSKHQESDESYEIVSEFGQVSEPELAGGKQGTVISVEKLFENVPARLKFLKTDSGENGQIKTTVKALGLSHPTVGFRFKVNGKMVFTWPKGQSDIQRAEQILGVSKLYPADGGYEGFSARIAYAAPNETFGNSRNIWLFANGRWIQDRSLQTAVGEAFRGLLMHGEFPYAVVWLDCPAEDIDVNIHPTKSQVKFREQRSAFRAVNRTLRAALEEAPWVKKLLKDENTAAPVVPQAEERTLEFSGDGFQDVNYATKEMHRPDVEAAVETFSVSYEKSIPVERNWVPRSIVDSPRPNANVETRGAQATPAIHEKENGEPAWSSLHVIGQANLTYIVAQGADKMVFVDQHAAHERVAYERLMNAFKSGKSEVQQHLIPLNIDLEEEHVEALMSFKEELGKLGLDIDQGGPTSILVRSSMMLIKENSIVKALVKLASEAVEKGDSFAFEKAVAEVCATMACHSVIRAGQALSVEEMKALLAEMDEFPLSSFCPHGRPVYVEYKFDKLERDFGRIV